MSRHDDRTRLLHMLEHAREAVAFAAKRNREDLDADRLLNLALVRLLEIVGEAAARVTTETRGQLPDVPWAEITGLRNRVVHGYDRVDFDVVWATVTSDLPPLVVQLEDFLASSRSSSAAP